MAVSKALMIEKALKDAKTKGVKPEDYLSDGNARYHSAIKSIRSVCIISAIPIVMYAILNVMIPISGIIGLIFGLIKSDISMTIYGLFATAITFCIIIILCVHYRLWKLMGKPSTIMAYILIIVSSLVVETSILAFYLFVQTDIPVNSFSNVLKVAFSIGFFMTFLVSCYAVQAICNYDAYKKWYKHFKYRIIKN